MSIDKEKISAIQKAPAPRDVKGVKRIIGHAKWHGWYLRYLADETAPISHLTKKDVEFKWESPQNRAFELLKKMLVVCPILQPPDWKLEFHVFVDASDSAVGAVLMQEKVKGWYRPVYYASRMLRPPERNYSMTKREAFGMIFGLYKLRHYLLGNKVIFMWIIRLWCS